MVPLGVFQSQLKGLEINKEWYFNTHKFQLSKLKEQKVLWANLNAKVTNFVAMFESIVVTYEIRVFFEGAQKEVFSSIF
jgi:hypothetical protein